MPEQSRQFTSHRVWLVKGWVHGLDEDGKREFKDKSYRTMQICAPDFPAAAELAGPALLTGWSSKPHEAEVRSISPILDADKEHTTVLVPKEAPDA